MKRLQHFFTSRHRIQRREMLRLAGTATVALPLLAACGAASAQISQTTASGAAAAPSSAATTTSAATATATLTTSAAGSATSSGAISAAAKAVPAGTSKLLFGTWTDNDQDKVLFQGMLDGFNKQHPDMQFGYLPVPGGTSAFLEKLSTLLAAGTPRMPSICTTPGW